MKKQKWFWIAVLGVMMAAPNALLMRYVIGEIDPFLANSIRFIIAFTITAPVVYIAVRRMRGIALKHSLIAAGAMIVAMTCFVKALETAPASYASIFLLLNPILLVIFSIKFTGERISHQAIAGITLSALGAACIVLVPIALRNSSGLVEFYPTATLLLIANCFAYPVAVIFYKKAHEGSGVSMIGLAGLTAGLALPVSLTLWCLSGAELPQSVGWQTVVALVYSGIFVNVVAKVLSIISYEHIGSVVTSSLAYFGSFLAVILPIIFLKEELALSTVIGGCLLLAGVYFAEKRQLHLSRKMHWFWRH